MDNRDGLEGVVGGIIVEVVVGEFFVGKGMSLMFGIYSVYTSFSLAVLKSSYLVVSCSNPNKPTPSAML